MLTRRDLLAGLVAAPGALAQRPRQPNIVLIVADDLGYGEIGVQGSDIPTPHIDSLARSGVRFTNGYVSCPVCSPTRAGLMTGRYQQRFGHEHNPGNAEQADENFGLPLNETTLADRLRSLGYATGAVGKWHLGYRPPYHPLKRGFDEFFGFLGGAHPYMNFRPAGVNAILRGSEPVDEKEYLTDAFAREATAFIERRKSQPFFLYLTYNAVHNPLQATERHLSRFSHIADTKRRTFAAMMTALDDGVGAVVKKLRDARLEDDTLICFVSDNGGPTPQTSARNNPLRGYKGEVLEGGIRVPFLMQWKSRLPAGRVYTQPVIALDIHPTAVAAAGGTIPASAALDGVDLLPSIRGDRKTAPHDALYWRFGGQQAVRKGDWKLLRLGQGEKLELYNLADDVAESRDRSGERPELVKDLEATYSAWDKQLIAPRWRRDARQRRRQRN